MQSRCLLLAFFIRIVMPTTYFVAKTSGNKLIASPDKSIVCSTKSLPVKYYASGFAIIVDCHRIFILFTSELNLFVTSVDDTNRTSGNMLQQVSLTLHWK